MKKHEFEDAPGIIGVISAIYGGTRFLFSCFVETHLNGNRYSWAKKLYKVLN